MDPGRAEARGLEVSPPGGSLDGATLEVLRNIRVPGTNNFFGNVAGMFLTDFGPAMQGLRSALAGQDAAAASAKAHSLEGSCLFLGAFRLAKIFTRLDLGAKSGDLSGAQEICDSAEKEFAAVKQSLDLALANG